MHEPLRTGGRRSAAVLDRVKAVGADADPAWFPTDGLVHLDLHTDNILAGDDGTLTGIVDWEGACAGDPRFDLVTFAYDLDGHDQPVWDVVEATGIEPRVLRGYVAHHSLRWTSWQIHHHTDDVPRQLDRAERVLALQHLGGRRTLAQLARRRRVVEVAPPPRSRRAHAREQRMLSHADARRMARRGASTTESAGPPGRPSIGPRVGSRSVPNARSVTRGPHIGEARTSALPQLARSGGRRRRCAAGDTCRGLDIVGSDRCALSPVASALACRKTRSSGRQPKGDEFRTG